MSEARRLLKDTGTAITKQNHILYEFEEWEAIDKEVAKLEVVAEAARHFAAAGYAEPNNHWREPLLEALKELE